MNRVKLGILSVGLAASFVVLAASCGGKQQGSSDVPPVVLVKTSAPATASPSAEPVAKKPNLRDPKQVTAVAWTDDEAIQALAQDCHWDPGGCLKAIETIAPNSIEGIEYLPEGQPQPNPETRTLPSAVCQSLEPLACARVASQSCVPDACSQTDYDCYPKCGQGCASCAGNCADKCESCKSTCKDEECRLTCAKSCGECRQGCLKALDHCVSATCSDEMETCFKTRDDEWTKSACPKVCPKVQDCVEKCPEVENDYTGERYRNACAQACLKKHGKGCPSTFDSICAGDPNASVNFWAYHSAHHPDGK